MKAILALEDGLVFEGESFGAEGERLGEVVFNTSIQGYQEILTDPSYKGQIVTMTYPLIGNYGINHEDSESLRPFVEGFVVRENSRIVSNFRAEESLSNYLKRYGIVGIEGIDTRALTLHLRNYGAKNGVISTTDLDARSLIEKAKAAPHMVGLDLAKDVTCKEAYEWGQATFSVNQLQVLASQVKLVQGQEKVACPHFVVVMDFGVKFNILRSLAKEGCRVKVVPAFTKADDILKMKPDGVLLSNGPGDPDAVKYAIVEIKKLIGKIPIFGICLGHQLLGLAFGGKTYKLKFGHHGGNQPVMDLRTRKVDITSQNHGFAVDIDSIPDKDVVLTHINLNDQTVEGMEHKNLPIFSVQYHPEHSPGPKDAAYLFKRFVDVMDKCRCAT